VVGNIADKDAALQASEAGVAEGNQAISALTNFELTQPARYFASKLTDDASGLPIFPAGSSWGQAPTMTVGKFQVAYVVERYCQLPLPVVNASLQCALKAQPASGSAKSGQETMDAPLAMQYRITVSVTGPKSSQAFVQTLVSF
jgi:Tfp pilus assembly protein PilX